MWAQSQPLSCLAWTELLIMWARSQPLSCLARPWIIDYVSPISIFVLLGLNLIIDYMSPMSTFVLLGLNWGSVLGIRSPGLEFRSMCLEGSAPHSSHHPHFLISIAVAYTNWRGFWQLVSIVWFRPEAGAVTVRAIICSVISASQQRLSDFCVDRDRNFDNQPPIRRNYTTWRQKTPSRRRKQATPYFFLNPRNQSLWAEALSPLMFLQISSGEVTRLFFKYGSSNLK